VQSITIREDCSCRHGFPLSLYLCVIFAVNLEIMSDKYTTAFHAIDYVTLSLIFFIDIMLLDLSILDLYFRA